MDPILYCDNSNDDNDLEVAAVLANVTKEDLEMAYCCSSLSTDQADFVPHRSSAVMTNLPRGNAVCVMQNSDPSNWTVYDLAYRGELTSLKQFMTEENLNFKAEGGRTPLMAAACNGWQHVVEFLLERGASVDATDDLGTTALQQACCQGFTSVANILLESDADVDLACKKGNTPLHYATHGGHKDCIQLLLEWGADVTLKNKSGFTPHYLASKIGNREVEDAFSKHLLRLLAD